MDVEQRAIQHFSCKLIWCLYFPRNYEIHYQESRIVQNLESPILKRVKLQYVSATKRNEAKLKIT